MTNQRTFERVPRVMRCADQRRGVVFFHSSDNHYGNPREVMLNLASRDSRFKRERFYGVADRQQSGAFPLFLPKVHVISPDRIPPAACDVEDQDAVKVVGTDYLFVDPCDGRNFFMTWIRFCSNKCAYVFWEWPNQVDPVPGHGVLGEWALPSGDSKLMDGRKGPAQSSLGWGLLQYKQEIARIEKWPDYRPDAKPEDIRAWSQYQPGSKVKPRVRYLDARFGNANSLLEDGVRTLFEEFDDIGLTFAETGSGRRNEIEEGKQMINAGLFYNVDQPVVDVINQPHLFVSSACRNTIFALQVWTGLDGGKGATKDPVDNIRYAYLKDCAHVDQRYLPGMGGAGCY